DAWRIKFILKIDMIIQDKGDIASWNKESEIIEAYVPIGGFEDPTYFMMAGGLPITIKKTPYEIINLTNIEEHAEGFYYVASSQAPSFLDRLEGNLSAKREYGIESLVNTPGLPQY